MSSRSSKFRKKMKESDPEKYVLYLQKQKEKSKQNRDKLKEDLAKKRPTKAAIKKKDHMKKLALARQKQYLSKIKESGETVGKSATGNGKKNQVKVMTRVQVHSKREMWRETRKKNRANLSGHKKAAIRKKDRERKAAGRLESSKAKDKGNEKDSVFKCKKSLWNATSKARSSMPKSAKLFVRVHGNLKRNCTPRKSDVFNNLPSPEAKRRLFSDSARASIKSLKATRIGRSAVVELATKLKRFASRRRIAKELQVSRNRDRVTLCRKNAFAAKKKAIIQQFYKREDISRVLPNKRFATKAGPGYLLQLSLKTVLAKFRQEHPEIKVGYAQFARLRPTNVRLLSTKYREYCVCVYCINVRYKLLTLNPLLEKENKIGNETDLSCVLLCPKADSDRFHDVTCIRGECKKCSNFGDRIRAYYQVIPEDKLVSWGAWKRETCDDGKCRRVIKTKTTTVKELIKELVEDVEHPVVGVNFFEHLHTAHWQYLQYNNIKTNLPDGWLLQVMDFAKNRSTIYEDEIKSAFYTPGQITMHPIVNYYTKAKGLGTVRHAVIAFSEDNQHDYHAVNHYHKEVDRLLHETMDNRVLVHVIFSDGCAAQYKSAGPFADVSLKANQVSRNFFGSEHGKGEGDGEIGIINRAIDRAICGKQVIINNASDAYNWCKDNLTLDEEFSKRSFLLVKKDQIVRKRPYTEVKTVPQTRKIHQMENVSRQPYTLKTRRLSCFCKFCRDACFPGGKGRLVGSCRNPAVGAFKIQHLKPKNTLAKDEECEQIPEEIGLEEIQMDPSLDLDNEELLIGSEADAPLDVLNECGVLEDIGGLHDVPDEVAKDLTKLVEENFETLERKAFFKFLQDLLIQLDFSSVQMVAVHMQDKIDEKYPIHLVNPGCEHYKTDDKSMLLYEGPEDVTPVSVYGDGNCLPRAGSILAFGDEDHHTEIRIRIALELSAFKDVYLDPCFIHPQMEDILKWYSVFSPFAKKGLSPEHVLEAEVISILSAGAYMGIWQIHALSSLLKTRINSVYPECGGPMLLNTMNRCIQPRVKNNEEAAYIMWTSTSGTSKTGLMWAPNHFVPCLPKEKRNSAISGETSEASEVQPLPNPPKSGLWVAVRLPLYKTGYRIFFGKILAVDAETQEIHVHYLKEDGKHYVLDASTSGKSWVQFEEAVAIPTLHTTVRGLSFRQNYFIDEQIKTRARALLLK